MLNKGFLEIEILNIFAALFKVEEAPLHTLSYLQVGQAVLLLISAPLPSQLFLHLGFDVDKQLLLNAPCLITVVWGQTAAINHAIEGSFPHAVS